MRDTRLWAHWLAASLIGGALVLAQSCDSGAPVAPPPSTASATKAGSSAATGKDKEKEDKDEKKKGDDDDDDDSSSDKASGDDDDDDSGSEDSSGSSSDDSGSDASGDDASIGSGSGSASMTDPGSYERPGADIGDDKTKADVLKCIKEGKFFDRIADANNCLPLDLAKVDCTVDGIKGFLEAIGFTNLKTSFTAKVAGEYAPFQIDFCVDCPPGNGIKQCETKDPPKKGGTKVFFAKTTDSKVEVRGMMIPIRPYRD